MEARGGIPSCSQGIMDFCGPKNYTYKYGDNGSIKLYMKVNIFWKLNPRERSITLTKLLIKHAKFTQKETGIGA